MSSHIQSYYYITILLLLPVRPLHHIFTLYCGTFKGAPLFIGHKIWSCRNIHIIFLSVTSTEGTPLQIQEKGTLFLIPETQVSPPFRGHLNTQKVTDHKEEGELSN